LFCITRKYMPEAELSNVIPAALRTQRSAVQ
jgi:hypothetical protein